MRHRKGFNHLGRTNSHRKAMLANMASSLILHKRIKTTEAKAKALRMYVEPLITKSKDDSTHSRRVVFSYLKDKYAVSELFREVSPKIADRPGGYTRILKIGNRLGDNAEMCIIELVDFNANMLEAQEAQKTKSTRRRRGAKKKPAEVSQDVQAEPLDETKETPAVKTEAVVESEEASADPAETSEGAVPQVEETDTAAENVKEEKEEAKVEAKDDSKKTEAVEEKKETPEDKKEEDKKTE